MRCVEIVLAVLNTARRVEPSAAIAYRMLLDLRRIANSTFGFKDMMLNDQDRGLETMTKITGAALKRMSSAANADEES